MHLELALLTPRHDSHPARPVTAASFALPVLEKPRIGRRLCASIGITLQPARPSSPNTPYSE